MNLKFQNITFGALLAGALSVFSSFFFNQPDKPVYKNSALPVGRRVEDLISKMTIEEKIAQMTLFKDRDSFITVQNQFREATVKEMLKNGGGMAGFISHTMGPDEFAVINNKIQRILAEETRLGIPGLIWGEGLHGFVGKKATSFPTPMGIASSWDTTLIRSIYSVIGKETRAVGVTQLYTPVIELAREPRWGRVGETFSEDPFLVGQVATSAITGLQGTNINIGMDHVAATAKHFVAHSQPEGGNNISPGNFPERILRENFLYPFEIAVKEARVRSIMPSYNEIDGIPSHSNTWLLGDVLRGEWGFGGYIIGDLGGIEDLYEVHFVARDVKEAAKMALAAGVDMDPVKNKPSYWTLAGMVKNGEIEMKRLDDAVRRILTLKFELGLFENPYVDPQRAVSVYNDPKHGELALKAAEEAMILLKNDGGILPLRENNIRTLAVIGPNAAEIHLGSYSREPLEGISVLEGIQSYAKGKFKVTYAEGCKITAKKSSFWDDGNPVPNSLKDDEQLISKAVEVAKAADVVLLVVGENETICREAWSESHRGDSDNLDLFGRQDELVKAVVETGKPVVALLLNERPLAVNYLAENAGALIEGWFLGAKTGSAVANVLFGKVNPSGKLTVTIPGSAGQLPCYYNKKPSRMRSYISGATCLFPFGYGLSYTTFKYGDLDISPKKIKPGEVATARVTVTNTGDVEGEEIVQLYIRDDVSSVTRPVKELKGFRKISLKPGESKVVSFNISDGELQFYNRDMKRVVEPGDFTIMAGANSESLIKSKLVVE